MERDLNGFGLSQNPWREQGGNEQTCPEKYFLDTISPKATEDLIPLSDSYRCICTFVDPTFAKLSSIIILVDLSKDLDLNPLAHILHKVVKVGVNNAVLDLKLPRGPPAELRNENGVG